MVVAGIDIGAITTKAVIMKEQKIKSYIIRKSGADLRKIAWDCLEQALQKAGYQLEDVETIVATGYGRISIPFARKQVTEITCHTKGAHWLNPAVRTIIDIGGQDSKIISVSESGQVIDFVMNDKCAAGTGRFLEVMAQALEVKLEDLGDLSLRSKKKIVISSMCTVFAESEVISLIADGCPKEDIIRGLHEAIANRIYSMAVRLPIQSTVTFTGGVAKNKGMILALRKKIRKIVYLPPEPQIVGAIGAALIAHNLLNIEKLH